MVTKSKLRLALAAEKGVDFKKLKEQKKRKATLKRKQGGVPRKSEPEADDDSVEQRDDGVDEDEEEDEDEAEEETINLDAVDESDTSDSEVEMEEKIPRNSRHGTQKGTQAAGDEDEDEGEDDDEEDDEDDEEDEEDEEDIPVSDLEDLDDDDKEDLVAHTRLLINNTSALLAALDRISIPTDSSAPFATHQSIVSSAETSDSIPDVSDDLQRELAFYSQCLDAARQGRAKLLAEGVPFSRPQDYFAEMVKEDAHMDRVKAKLVEEASAKKAAAEARKQRDLKKFGKQVQVAKLQERQKAKRETLDKIKTLKRKRQESSGDLGTKEADLFDVGVDDEMAKHSQRSGAGRGNKSGGSRAGGASGPSANAKRQKKNEKYGFGGKKRHAKSGDAMSSGDLSGFNSRKMKAGGKPGGKPKAKAPRPGKSRRKAMTK